MRNYNQKYKVLKVVVHILIRQINLIKQANLFFCGDKNTT